MSLFERVFKALPALSTRKKERMDIPNRNMIAQDPKRTTIAILGHDLILLVLEALHVSHPPSMQAARLVCSNFHYLAEYIACNTLNIDLCLPNSPDKTSPELGKLQQRGLLAAVRTVKGRVHGHDGNFTRSSTPRVQLFCQLLPLMTGLRDMYWQGGFLPYTILNELAKRPQIRLHVQLNSPDHIILLQSLANNVNLSSLGARHKYRSAQDCLTFMRPLKKVLLTCPNIKDLTIDVSMPSGGCVIYSMPLEYHGLGFVNGEKPPALERLEIFEYPFGPDEEEYWTETFDWSRLKSFELHHMRAAKLPLSIMPRLDKLKNVVLKNAQAREGVKRFYLEVPASLEKIEVQTVESISLAGITRHGKALKELEIHQNEGHSKRWSEQAIATSDLLELQSQCPFIEDLRLDLSRSKDWPYESLQTLAGFPRLRKLTIYFELGLEGDNVVLPKVTFAAVQMLFQYLRQHSSRQPSLLRELHIYSGSPPGIGFGYPSPAAFWPRYNSMHFRCLLSVRDDEAAVGTFICDCPELSKEANQLLRGEIGILVKPSGFERMYEDEKVDVARNGPKARKEWKAHY